MRDLYMSLFPKMKKITYVSGGYTLDTLGQFKNIIQNFMAYNVKYLQNIKQKFNRKKIYEKGKLLTFVNKDQLNTKTL